MDCCASLCIGDAPVGCFDLEDYDTREFRNLNAKEAFVHGLNRCRPSGRGLRPAKFINKQIVELEALKQVAGSGYVELGHSLVYGLRTLIL